MSYLEISILASIFALLCFASIIPIYVVVFSNNYAKTEPTDIEEAELKKKGYYKLNFLQRFILIKCDNLLCKICAFIFWGYIIVSLILTTLGFFR